MKKLLSILLFGVASSAIASAYTGVSVSNDNNTGINTVTGKLYLSKELGNGFYLNEYAKYYYDDNSFQQLQNFDVPEASFFQNQFLDSNSLLTYKYGNGLFTTGGFRAYQQLDNGTFSNRVELTNGYSSNLSDKLSQSTYFSVFHYNADGSYKLWFENDLEYSFNDQWSVDTNLSVYRYANTNVIDNSYNLDVLMQINYNITKSISIYASQELTRNLVSNELTNVSELGIGTTW